MAMIRYEPVRALDNISEELNRLVASRFGQFFPEEELMDTAWSPAVDIKEEDEQFVVTADIPGVEAKDIEVTMDNGVLSIKGERKAERKEEKKGYRRMERFAGTFYRRFTLPDSADPEKVNATTKQGVLTVTIGKSEKRKPHRIKVSS
ncbi:MAG: Hsp20/alpha crystallin family protein [Gammaproteobacteria bacterium]|jgi:HSP20 family protein